MKLSRLGALLLVTSGVALLWFRFNAPPGDLTGAARQFAVQGDLITYYLPMTELAAARLSEGELPLWNPHGCSGIPLLATMQPGVFHPATWLALWLPAHRALSVRMWFACWLAGVLGAWMFRAFGSSWMASCAGGVLYVFACVLGQTLWPPAASTLAMFPWILLCVHQLLVAPKTPARLGWWCGLAAGVALQVLAGFPQYFVYGALVAGCFAAHRLVTKAARPASVLWLASSVAVGVGIAAVQLLPSLELVGTSVRNSDLSATAIHYLTIWDPYGARDVVRAMFDPSPALASFHLGSGGGYLGMGALLLVGVGIASGWKRSSTWLWVAIACVSLVLSNGMLGASEPLYRVFSELPLVGSFRTPERLRFVTLFALVVLAVQGFQQLRAAGEGTPAISRERLRGTIVVGTVASAVALLGLGVGVGTWRVAAAGVLAIAVSESALGVGLRRVSEFAFFALLVLDVAHATGEHGIFREIPVEMSNRYSTPDRGRSLPEGFFQNERDEVGWGRLELVRYRPHLATSPSEGSYRVSCYEPLVPAQWPALEAAIANKPGIGATLFDLLPDAAPGFYDVAGVERIILGSDRGPEAVSNPDALPRAYVTASYEVRTQQQAFAHLRDADFDFHRGALLERSAGFASGPPVPVAAARIVEYAPERVVIEAESDGPALLVLSDSHYPGWRATRDGATVEILRANGLYRAIELSGGRSRVVFDYVPGSLRVGGLISLASLSILVGVAGFGLRGMTIRE